MLIRNLILLNRNTCIRFKPHCSPKSISLTSVLLNESTSNRHLSTNDCQPKCYSNVKTTFQPKIFGIDPRYSSKLQFNLSPFHISKRNLSSLTDKSGELNSKLDESVKDTIIDLTGNLNSDQVQNVLNNGSQQLADLSVAALNIGSNYTPIGWCVHYLDFLNSVFPWWGAIAVGTVILRLTMFPFVISAQRTASKLNELLPQQAILKEKMNQARLIGDTMEFARLANESHTLFKRNNVNPIKSMLTPLTQVPLFLTFFLTLRRMANYPVESLKTGGFYWVTDLSIPDPMYVLPVVCSLTLWATLEISFKSGQNPNQTVIFKYGARIIPILTLIFTYDFPAAIMTYWCTNNFLSVIQVTMLRQPKIREFFNIPPIKVNPSQLSVNKKSFKNHFKETMENAKINKLIEERKTIDEITFKKAGIGPLKKTFKHNPTRIRNN